MQAAGSSSKPVEATRSAVLVEEAPHAAPALRAATVQRLSDVFGKGEGGYFCIKIPDLLHLRRSGRLLAFGEARTGSCSDYAATDLVTKRSDDGGRAPPCGSSPPTLACTLARAHP